LLPDSFPTKPCLRILIPLFVLKLDLFSREVLIYLSSLISTANKKRTNALDKNLRPGFLAIGVKKRHVCVEKPSNFPNMLNFCLFLNIKSFSGIIKLPKNVYFVEFFIKTTKARMIRAQTVPTGG